MKLSSLDQLTTLKPDGRETFSGKLFNLGFNFVANASTDFIVAIAEGASIDDALLKQKPLVRAVLNSAKIKPFLPILESAVNNGFIDVDTLTNMKGKAN